MGDCPPLALDSYAFPTGPGDVGLDYEEITYDAPLGPTRAWVVPGGDGRRWAVMCHGWTAERRELVRMLPAFHEQGFTSVVIDYRNDIGAPVDPSGRYRFGLSEWEDLEAAVGLVPEAAESMVLAGCSTGGALVMRFLEKSSLAGRVDAVVLDAPNIVLADTFRHATDSSVTPQMFRVGLWLADVRWQVGWAAADYVSRAEQILRVPALVFHGTADATVPISESQQLAARVPHLVELVETENAGHVMSWNADPDRYEGILEGFLGRIATLELELNRRRRPVEPGTEGREDDQVTGGDSTVADRLPHGQGHRRRAGVAVLVDVHEHGLLGETQLLADRLDDPQVGLMRDDQADLRHRTAHPVEHVEGRLAHPLHGLHEDATAVHHQPVVVTAGQRGLVERVAGATGGESEDLGGTPVRAGHHPEHLGSGRLRAHHHRPGTIAEQDGRGPVLHRDHPC